ncbi:MAG: CBS domain-containing protein [Phycisphaerae bacterium]
MNTVEQILMSKGPDVIVAVGTNTVIEAAKMMAQANVGSVIIKEGQAPVGIFTERDLLRKVVATGKDPNTTPLSQVMSSPVRTVELATPIAEASQVLTTHHIRHLAVVEENALVGMISFRDVLKAEVELAEARSQGPVC